MYHQILTENIIYRQFMSFIQLIRYFEMKSMNTGYDQTIKKKDSKMFLFKNMFVFIMQYYCTFTLEGFLILRGTFCLLIEFLEKGNYMYLQKFTDIFVQHLRRVTIQRLWGAKDRSFKTIKISIKFLERKKKILSTYNIFYMAIKTLIFLSLFKKKKLLLLKTILTFQSMLNNIFEINQLCKP